MARGPVALHLRTVARTRWRSLAAVALLFGLTAGLATATWASARRTSSAYDRMLQANRATDLSVDYGPQRPDVARRIAEIPGVTGSATYVALTAARWDPGEGPADSTFETIGSLDGRYFDRDRVAVVRGRMPSPDDPGEVAVNAATIDRDGLDVGDRFRLAVVSDEDLESTDDPSTLQPRGTQDVRVVGEVVFGDEVIQDDYDVQSRLLVTPPLTQRFADIQGYAWQGLALAPGVDRDRVSADVRDIVSGALSDDPESGGFVLIRDTDEDRARVDRAILPQVSALLIAAGLVAAVALVLVVQAAGRMVRSTEPELRTYRALGARREQQLLAGIAPFLVAIAVGVVVAVGFAIALSPLSPVGALHRVEPSPGLDVDVVAVLGGTIGLAAAVTLGATVAAILALRRLRATTTAHLARPSRVMALLQHAGAPPSIIAGARAALVPTPDRGAAPIRSITVGTIVATVALVAALCFGASLRNLVDEPHLYGWNWDVALVDDAGYGELDADRTAAVMSSDPDVAGWTGMGLSSTEIDGRTVPLIGVLPSNGVRPAVISGRPPAADDEIAFGRRTMRLLGVAEGDTVRYGDERVPLRVVGTVSLPAIGQVHSSHPSPGDGAMVTIGTLQRSVGGWAAGDDPAWGMSVAAVEFQPGTDVERATERLGGEIGDIGSYPGSTSITGVPRPAEIVNARDVTAAPMAMAFVLMAAALISLGLALVGNVRRRRSELAVLRALGFNPRQLVSSVLTQSVLVTALGLVVGVPLGVLAGRWAWGAFTDRLSVVDQPIIPWAQLLATVAVILAVALLASVVPARLAARVRVVDRRTTT